VSLAALSLLVFAIPGVASAGKKECADAFVQAQQLKQDGALKKAREQLLICAKDECMAAVRKDCLGWLDEVAASMPSIVIDAKGPDGKETFDVKVSIDGEVVSDKLDVKAIELDPGTHKLVFELAGREPIEREVILRQGQKNKSIEVSFAKKAAEPKAAPEPEPAPEPQPERKAPVLAYVLGGVGVVALAGTGYFWLGSEAKKSDLEASKCEPNCDQGDVDAIKRQRLFGDIALGVGLACIGTAAYLLLQPAPAKQEKAMLGVRVGPKGAFAGLSGHF